MSGERPTPEELLGGTLPENHPTEAAQTTPEGQTPGTTETPAEPDSFTGLDPAALAAMDPQQAYRAMQADYTRKTQALAEQRKQFEGLDVNAAQEAIQFVTNLSSDPQFALSVHQELSNALQQAGLTPAQAAQAATETLTPAAEPDPFALPVEEPAIHPEILSRLSQAEQYIQQIEQQRQFDTYSNQLASQEAAIRAAHADWTDDDITSVYRHAYAYGGDLHQAEQAYLAEQQSIINRYFQSKGNVPSGEPSSTGFALQPDNLTREQMMERATERLKEALNQG